MLWACQLLQMATSMMKITISFPREPCLDCLLQFSFNLRFESILQMPPFLSYAYILTNLKLKLDVTKLLHVAENQPAKRSICNIGLKFRIALYPFHSLWLLFGLSVYRFGCFTVVGTLGCFWVQIWVTFQLFLACPVWHGDKCMCKCVSWCVFMYIAILLISLPDDCTLFIVHINILMSNYMWLPDGRTVLFLAANSMFQYGSN